MAIAMKVKAGPRTVSGTSQSRRLRRSGDIPAVLYGVGKAPQNLQLNARDFSRSLDAQTSEHLIMDLEVAEGDVRKVLLQDVQHHPISHDVIHADFHEISMTEKLHIKVPVRLVGDAAGVTQQGGVLDHILREIEIACLPTDIPEHIDIDVSALMIGDNVHAGDIKLDPAKFQLVTAKTVAVVTLSAMRAEEEVAPAAAAATAEPEVLREKKPEEGAEEAGKDGKKPEAGKADDKKPAADAKKPAAKEAKK